MSLIQLNSVYFQYDSSNTIFDNLNVTIDTSWKTGVVGRNGCGKTTFFKLIVGKLQPFKGTINVSASISYFPYIPEGKFQTTLDVIRNSIKPFDSWQAQMDLLLKKGDTESLKEYGKILEQYQDADGYSIDALIKKEALNIEVNERLLKSNFYSLSEGEKTRALIIALFLKKHTFPLIDEPTNHLDAKGREILGRYLKQKKGFMLISHDRYFMDLCVDHIISISKTNIYVENGNFSSWKSNKENMKKFEERKRRSLERVIKSLSRAARDGKEWAEKKEKDKKRKQGQKERVDKGYSSHKAAKSMKRAISIRQRSERKLAEEKSFIKEFEKNRTLKIPLKHDTPDNILQVSHITIILNGNLIIKDLSFSLKKGDRIAVTGKNGAGKTTLLRAISGEIEIQSGNIYKPKRLKIIRAYQKPLWQSGMLQDYLRQSRINETDFKNILGSFDVSGEILERPLETFSEGERKKVDLCRSFIEPADILLWDEPLNYVDTYARERIERAILKYSPTLLFVEHDRYFINNIAKSIIPLKSSF